jgi:hypothetical protein
MAGTLEPRPAATQRPPPPPPPPPPNSTQGRERELQGPLSLSWGVPRFARPGGADSTSGGIKKAPQNRGA